MAKIFYLLICVFSPLLAPFIISFFVLLDSKSNKSKISLYFISFAFSLMLGLINSKKKIESDLVNYMLFFENCNDYNFIEYLAFHGKEPLFFSLTYFLNLILNSNFELYLIVITFIPYFVLSSYLITVFFKKNLNFHLIITFLWIFFLFPNLFSLSAHITRQFISSVFVIIFLTEIVINKRYLHYLLLISVLFHSSSIIFIFIYFIPRRELTFKVKTFYLAIFSLIIFFIFSLNSVFSEVFSGIPIIGYVMERFNKIGVKQLESLSVLSFILSLLTIYFFRVSLKTYDKMNIALYELTSICLFVFILINFNNSEIALRYSYYLYFLFPISFLFILDKFQKKIGFIKFYPQLFIVNLIFFIWFWYKLNNGIWSYDEYTNFFILNIF